MTPSRNAMTCQQFQEQLADLIGSGENAAAHPHLRGCIRCTVLLSDLEAIAEAARQLFPIVEPPEKLWKQIEIAIKDDQKSLIPD